MGIKTECLARRYVIKEMLVSIYNKNMRKFVVSLLVIVAIGLGSLLFIRVFFGGDEDTWICSNNQWVMHGNPAALKPQTGCGEVLKQNIQTFNEAGLSLVVEVPEGMTFRKEIADDAGRVRVASFYIEKGKSDKPDYQLYATYEPMNSVTDEALERIKTGLSPQTIKEVSVGGYTGIEGLIEISGPKNHYVTAIVKDGKLFTISTFPPTQENKQITDQIISTIKFQ